MEHLTKQTFMEKVFNYGKYQDWKFEGDLPCIIDFYADWCAPCKMVAPILEELAETYKGKINMTGLLDLTRLQKKIPLQAIIFLLHLWVILDLQELLFGLI